MDSIRPYSRDRASDLCETEPIRTQLLDPKRTTKETDETKRKLDFAKKVSICFFPMYKCHCRFYLEQTNTTRIISPK